MAVLAEKGKMSVQSRHTNIPPPAWGLTDMIIPIPIIWIGSTNLADYWSIPTPAYMQCSAWFRAWTLDLALVWRVSPILKFQPYNISMFGHKVYGGGGGVKLDGGGDK